MKKGNNKMSMEQRFVVNGINNDKIELVSNYDVRKLNRLLDTKDRMWLSKIKQVREEIEALKPNNTNFKYYEGETRAINKVLKIIDRIVESEE
jgi:hypothetical protein